jgi:hypothetical protein
MTHALTSSQFRFSLVLPAIGNVPEGVDIASSGQVIISGPTYYLLVLYTNVATIGVTPNLREQPGPKSVVSGRPVFDVYEIQLLTIEDLVAEWQKEANVAGEPTKEERARRHIPTFLNEVYRLSQLGDTDTAGFKIYDFLDRVLIDGFFGVCDSILSQVDVDQLDTKLMRSFLSSTIPAKRKLPSRALLFKKIEAKMLVLRGPEKTRKILANLA